MSTSVSAPTTPAGAMMIGPTKAGKTSLLATLELASRVSRFPILDQVGVFPANSATEELFENARMIGEVGHVEFGATQKPQEYLVDLRYTEPGGCLTLGLRKPERTFRFTVIDGRGGDLIGIPPSELAKQSDRPDLADLHKRRSELIAMAARCRGLIVCVDSSNASSATSFFRGMNQFLRDVSKSCDGRVPFERVTIVMTKADRLVEREGPRAFASLAQMNPARWALELVGEFALRDLFIHLSAEARQRVLCGWASVYGFIPEDGSVNFAPLESGGRLAVYRENDAGWSNRWRPHRVLDPFVYIATGHPAGLVRLAEPAAHLS